jgi:molybdopterin synthase sulfur carrier subunit
MVTVLYFAGIKEKLGLGREALDLPPGVRHVGSLAATLRSRGDIWASALAGGPALRVAVNQSMATMDAAIADGDEVAFFPPVTGG